MDLRAVCLVRAILNGSEVDVEDNGNVAGVRDVDVGVGVCDAGGKDREKRRRGRCFNTRASKGRLIWEAESALGGRAVGPCAGACQEFLTGCVWLFFPYCN